MNMIVFNFSFLLLLFISACRPEYESNFPTPRTNGDEADSTFLHALTDQEIVDQVVTSATEISYLALGDSYTIGESVPPEERWPVQLHDKINEENSSFEINYPDIIAQTGWTTFALSTAMDNAGVDSLQYDLVSLLIGVNNQYQGQSLEAYAESYTDLLERAINIAGNDPNRVFVVSIPDYGYTPFGLNNQASISEQLEAFNATCQAITEEHGVAHYNITPISQQWPETEGLVVNDNLHPSGYQYSLWVESFWEGVLSQLSD